MDRLTRHHQRFSAGRQHRDLAPGIQHGVDQFGAGVEHVFTVVDHEQHLAGTQGGGEFAQVGGARTVDGGGLGDRSHHGSEVVRRREFGQHDLPAVPRDHLVCSRQCQGGLARPAGSGDRHDAVARHQFEQVFEVLVATDQPGPCDRQGRAPRGRRCKVGVRRRAGRGRRRVVRVGLDDNHLTDESVAMATDRADEPLLYAVVADRAAGRLDPGGQRRLGDEAITPHLVEELDLADHAVAVHDQVHEDVEHLGVEGGRGRRRPASLAGRRRGRCARSETASLPAPNRRAHWRLDGARGGAWPRTVALRCARDRHLRGGDVWARTDRVAPETRLGQPDPPRAVTPLQ